MCRDIGLRIKPRLSAGASLTYLMLLAWPALVGAACAGDAGGSDTSSGDTFVVGDTSVSDSSEVLDSGVDTTSIDTADSNAPIDTTAPDSEVDTQVDTEVDSEPDSALDTDDTTRPEDTTPDDADVELIDVPDVVTPPTGETCPEALPVTLPVSFTAPVVVSGDTSELADDYDTEAGVCPGVDWALGLGSPDEVWSFTAPVAGSYKITLTSSADLGMYVLGGCTAASIGQCLRAADEIGPSDENPDVARVTLVARQTIYVVVDSFTADPISMGAYQLTFDPPLAAPLGDVCGAPINIQQGPGGFVGSGDNGEATALSDDYDAAGCGPVFDGSGVADQVWRFVPPATGPYTVTVTPTGSADPMIYFFDDASCGGSCLDQVDDFGGGVAESTTIDRVAGDDLYMVVDSWLPEAGGQYVIKVAPACQPVCTSGSCADDGCGKRCPCAADATCNTGSNVCETCMPSCGANECGGDDGCGGTCGCDVDERCDPVAQVCIVPTAGDTCADAVALMTAGNGSFSGSGDLGAGRADDVATGTCPAASGLPFDGVGTPDEAWTFRVARDGSYVVTVASDEDADVYFMLFTGPGCADAACLGAADDGLIGESDTADFELTAGVDYTLVVDTWNVDEAGAYTITVEPAPVEGDGCRAPYLLVRGGDGVWAASGDLTLVDDGDDDEFEVGTCADLGHATFPPDGVDTPDEVYELHVPRTGPYKIRATTGVGVDVFVQVLEGAACDTATCVGYIDEVYTNAIEEVTLTLQATETYWLVVDSYAPNAAGAYTLEVVSACVPSCAADSCADDGCGTPCACASGTVCALEECVALPGDSCLAPLSLSSAGAGQSGQGDLATVNLVDDFTASGCPDLGSSRPAAGAGTRDEVFALSVSASGGYTIQVTPASGLDVTWSLYAGASCASATCVGYLDAALAGQSETVSLALTAGTSYWLVVDMDASSTASSFTVSVAPVSSGDGCASATPLVLGVREAGTTLGGSDHVNGLACAGTVDGAGRADVIYAVTLPLAGAYTFTLTPSGGADLAAYALAQGTQGCDASVCLAGSNAAGVNGTEVINVSAAAGAVDYIVVDGATAAGAYALNTTTSVKQCATDLFFAQYNEPTSASGNRKSLEIYNGTAQAVNLSGYSVRRANNGATSGSSVSTLSLPNVMLEKGDVFVMCNDGTGFPAGVCDQIVSVLNFNGNDALTLFKGTTELDTIGVFGVDPGDAGWTVGSGKTADVTLVRMPAVSSGTTSWTVGATQWLVLAANDFSDLGSHRYFWGCDAP